MVCWPRRSGGLSVEAVVHVDGRFHPITIKVWELSGEQSAGLQVCGHAAFLYQSMPVLDHALVLRTVDPRVVIANDFAATQPRENLVHDLGAVGSGSTPRRHQCRPEVPPSARPCRPCSFPEGAETPYARRAILEQEEV